MSDTNKDNLNKIKPPDPAFPVYDCLSCIAHKFKFCNFVLGDNYCNNFHTFTKLKKISVIENTVKLNYRKD